jgi:isoleucyl-tRNA synthetase
MPIPDESLEDAALEEAWEKVLTVRDAVYRQIEIARQEKIIAKPLEAKVTISLPSDALTAVSRYEKDLPRVLIVSEVELCQNDGSEVAVKVEQASGQKCERCWLVLPDVGMDENHPTICARCARAIAELTSNVGG